MDHVETVDHDRSPRWVSVWNNGNAWATVFLPGWWRRGCQGKVHASAKAQKTVARAQLAEKCEKSWRLQNSLRRWGRKNAHRTAAGPWFAKKMRHSGWRKSPHCILCVPVGQFGTTPLLRARSQERTWRWQNALARLWGGRCHSRCQTYWNSWEKIRIGLHELKEEVERGRYISEQKQVREVAERRGTSEKLWLRDWVAQSLID